MVSSYSYYANFSTQYKAVIDKAIELGFLLPSTNQQKLQDTLMRIMISSGVFAKADLIYMMINDAGLNFARINWKNPAAFLLSVNGPVEFMRNYGPYVSTLEKSWLGTGWAPALNAVNYTLNSNCVITKAASCYGASGFFISSVDANRTSIYFIDRVRAIQNNNNTAASLTSFPLMALFMNRRTASNAFTLQTAQAGSGVVTDISSALPSVSMGSGEVFLGGYGGVDIPDYSYATLGTGHPLEFALVGGNITNTEINTFHAALSAYGNSLRYQEQFFFSGNYTVPTGITQLFVECWGGGGAGRGYSTTATSTGGGGGGGAYAASLIPVTPGAIIPFVCGAGGLGTTAAGASGSDTSWNSGQIIAKGGSGAGTVPTTAALGGQASASVGTIKFNGGNGGLGGTALATATGSGGSAAGALANGVAGVNGAAGITVARRVLYTMLGGSTPGYALANSANSDGTACSMSAGGGGARRTSGSRVGGNGGQGYIRVSIPRIY